jgi:hypothetical protein
VCPGRLAATDVVAAAAVAVTQAVTTRTVAPSRKLRYVWRITEPG